MRRFFRFSIRDLLWLTLVVAMAVMWFVRESREAQLRAEADQARKLATTWRMAAGGLERAMEEVGNHDVQWHFSRSKIALTYNGGLGPATFDYDFAEPSAEPDKPDRGGLNEVPSMPLLPGNVVPGGSVTPAKPLVPDPVDPDDLLPPARNPSN